jgi:predicted PurR-regulated permease PerM
LRLRDNFVRYPTTTPERDHRGCCVDDRPGVAARGRLHARSPLPNPGPPRTLVVAAAWSWRLLLVGVVAYVVARVLALLWLVVVPVLAALLLTALVRPVAVHLRRQLPGPAAAAVTLLLSVLVLLGLGVGVGVRFAQQLPTLSDEVVDTIGQLRDQLRGLGIGQEQLDQIQRVATGWVQEHQSDFLAYVTTGAGYLLEFLTLVVLALFVTFFLLYDGARVWHWLLRPLPAGTDVRFDRAGRVAWATLTAYVHGTAVIATFHGVVIGVVLFLLHVPLVLPLAVLVFFGGFVPLVGALTAGGVSVLIALGTRGGVTAAILLGVLLAESQVEAHLLQPLVMGRYVRLHPLAIGLAIALGSVLGGVLGAIVAVPLAAIVYRAAPLLTTRARRAPRPRSEATVARRGPLTRRPRGGRC